MVKCFQFSEADNVDWSPQPVNIDDMKNTLIANFENKIRTLLHE